MNVVFCSSEVYPFAKTGGLGDVCGSLPKALARTGLNVSVFLPGYSTVRSAGPRVDKVTESVSISDPGDNVKVYFIHHRDYFDRGGLYGDSSGDYPDNLERFGYFCRQMLAAVKQLDIQPDIVHCHDWQTALIPVLLNEEHKGEAFYARAKSVLTIHNLAFQGMFPKEHYDYLGLDHGLFGQHAFEFYGKVNVLKAGIIYADRVTTVSPRYAQEIQTPLFGCGLEGVLKGRNDRIAGILNGLDGEIWNPKRDRHIFTPFDSGDFKAAKASNKERLQKQLGLSVLPKAPLFGFVGRLTEQKGADLIIESLEDFVKMGAQAVLLGIADRRVQDKMVGIARSFPANIAACPEFNEPLGHQIYAGCDFFLMPSRFEPCGLSQMISMRYATVPVVYKTGGLADTVRPFSKSGSGGNGVVFESYTKDHFMHAVSDAIRIFANGDDMECLRRNALGAEFSWERSAEQYRELYDICASSE